MTENNSKSDHSSTSEERVKNDRPALPRADSKRVIELAKEFEIKAKTVEESPVSPKQKKKTAGLGTKLKHVFQFWKKQDEINKKTLYESRSLDNLHSEADLGSSPRELSNEGSPPPLPGPAATIPRTRSSTVGHADQPSPTKANLSDLRASASPKVKRKRGISEGKPKNKKDGNKHATDSKAVDTNSTGEQLSPNTQSKARKRITSMRVQSTGGHNNAEFVALEHQRAASSSSRMELKLDQLKPSSDNDTSFQQSNASLSPKGNLNSDRRSRSRSHDSTPPTSPKSVDQSPAAENVLTSESSDDDDDDDRNVEKEDAGSVVKWIKK